MRALAAFPDRRSVALIDHPEPSLASPRSVLVRTLEVGVCGTDGELCAFHFGTAPAGEDHFVLGHEALGIVEAHGDGVTDLRVGDLVVPSVRRPCGRADCPACLEGHQDFCLTGMFTERGIRGAHGFLTEHFVEEDRYLYRVPAGLREVAILTEPLTIAAKGLRQYLAVQRRLPWLREADDTALFAGRRALVLGAGPVGLLGAMLLRQRGCDVHVYSREPDGGLNARLVEEMGAVYLSAEGLTVAQMSAEIGDVELVYEAAGAPALSLAVLEQMAPNGAFILTGATGGGERVDLGAASLLNHLVERNVALIGTVNASPADFHSAIQALEAFHWSSPTVLPAFITGRRSLDEFCACALDRQGIKDIIDLTATD